MTNEQTWAVAAAAVACIAAITDLRTGKIYNWLTFPAAFAAFGAHAWYDGAAGLGYSVAAWFVGVAVFLPLAAIGKMGMGDVKLLGAIGAIWGTRHCINVMLYSAVVAIPHSFLVLWWNYGNNAIPVLLVSLETGAFRDKTIEKSEDADHSGPATARCSDDAANHDAKAPNLPTSCGPGATTDSAAGSGATPAMASGTVDGATPARRLSLKHGPDYFIGVVLSWYFPLPGLFG